jgi:hypothetical protein
MSDEVIATEPEATQEVIPEVLAAAPETGTPAPEKKKRGRRPKVVAAPAPAPEPVKATRKRRVPVARLSAGDRALNAALANAEKERIKAIEEVAKMMELTQAKQARHDSINWKIAALKREAPMNTSFPHTPQMPYPQQAPGYPLPPQYPQPPAYPVAGAPTYIPPAMRQPALPVEPRANGGAEGIVDDTENDDPDKFLTATGAVGGRGWQ